MKNFNLIFLLTSIILSACASNSYISKAPVNEINIDGNIDDWSGDLKYIEDENSAIGVKNDKDNLYICFTTTDRSKIRQIINLGFIVWLKPINAKTLGVKYPVNSINKKDLYFRRGNPRIIENDSTYKSFIKKNTEFLIINDENFPLYGSHIGANSGYRISLGFHNGQFIYELSVPFIHFLDQYIPIIEIPKKKLVISFETGDIDISLNSNKRFFPDNSRIGDGSDAFGGRRPPRGPNLMSGIDDKLDISITVELQ